MDSIEDNGEGKENRWCFRTSGFTKDKWLGQWRIGVVICRLVDQRATVLGLKGIFWWVQLDK